MPRMPGETPAFPVGSVWHLCTGDRAGVGSQGARGYLNATAVGFPELCLEEDRTGQGRSPVEEISRWTEGERDTEDKVDDEDGPLQ